MISKHLNNNVIAAYRST